MLSVPDGAETTRSLTRQPPRLARLTMYALSALGLGIALGLMFLRGRPEGHPVLIVADGMIRTWTNAFRVLVVPFVASHLYLALAGTRVPTGQLGRVGVLAPVVFLLLLTAVFLASFIVTAWLMSLPFLSGLTLQATSAEVRPAGPGPESTGWVDGLIPPNIFAALGGNNILPVMVFTIAFGLAARRLAPVLQHTLAQGFRAVGETTFVLVEWLLLATPLVLFALGITSGARSGVRIGTSVVAFTALESALLLLAVLALYPVAALLGGVSLLRFARAVWPAQMAAAATRSSLATLPALMVGAEAGLGLPASIAGYVLPLGGSLLKLSRGVSEPVTLLFLARLLGIPLSFEQLIAFTGAMILLSATSPGIPRVTSGTMSMPLYVAVGIPPEYVVLLAATSAVTDVLMTVLNSTGYMTAAVLVARFAPTAGSVSLAPGQVGLAESEKSDRIAI